MGVPPRGDEAAATRRASSELRGPVRTAEHVLELYPEVDGMLAALDTDVDAARELVWIETFIFRDDRLGRAFAERLAAAAARGVDVRLLYDPIGSSHTGQRFFHDLARRGVRVRAYRPAGVVARTRSLWPRDHSRIVVVDGGAYAGGAAWGDEWLPARAGGGGWHDVCLRVQGPCVADMRGVFAQRWAEAAGEPSTPRTYATGRRYRDVEFVADASSHRNAVFARYRGRIRAARARVWIENAYFFPPAALRGELYRAAARGVDVCVVLPGRTDLPTIKSAARAELSAWLARGLRVYEYAPTVLHAKFAVVDDDWATVGTFNGNVTSLRWVNEANVFVRDPAFVARAAELFRRDLSDSVPVTREALRARGPFERLRDAVNHAAMALLEGGRSRA